MSLESTAKDSNPVDLPGGLSYWQGTDPSLLYVRARWYDPSTGEWLSVDPVEGQPRYLYVGQAPTWGVDPSGLQRENPWQKRWSSEGRYNDVDVHVSRGNRIYVYSEAGGHQGTVLGKLSSPGQ